jgi:hypothetical protein
VVEVREELQAEVGGGRVERQHAVLVPHGLAAGLQRRVRVAEAAHAAHRPEVVIEGPVLLHENHDVLDVLDRPSANRRWDGGGARDAGSQHAGRRRSGGSSATRNLQEPSAIKRKLVCHAAYVSSRRRTQRETPAIST